MSGSRASETMIRAASESAPAHRHRPIGSVGAVLDVAYFQKYSSVAGAMTTRRRPDGSHKINAACPWYSS